MHMVGAKISGHGILRIEQFAACSVCLILHFLRSARALERNLSQLDLLLLLFLLVAVASTVIWQDFSASNRCG